MTNQRELRLEVGTEVPWVLSGPGASKYVFVNDYLGYLADRNYSPRTLRAYGYGGYCLRAPAQGSCPYANICEHCPSFHTDATHLGILAAQRLDAQDLAADAEQRGWSAEADRHRKLIARLDTLIAQSTPA